MDQPSLYDDDIVSWAEEQAAALRELATRPGLTNALDWENVIEEIETSGRSQIQGVESALSLVLIHALKYLSASVAQPASSWRVGGLTYQTTARRNDRPAMRQRIDWEDLWISAKTSADAQLRLFGDRLVDGLPAAMPFTSDELVSRGFDMDRALERLASAMEMPGDRH
ncbi:DUF29 domain-containing protein [Methylobacterium nigriterrae]|uniref:DUF29 domain-containing protein n=1 Tax=Methylobacterium nigriterrae TaxID=3127512 RepID=UPI0030139C4A